MVGLALAVTPAVARTGRPGGPSIHGPNVNVTAKALAQSETTIAVDPTDPLAWLAASNDHGGTATVYETLDAGRTWADAAVGLSTFCYHPWLAFNAMGDAFFSYECSGTTVIQWIAYRQAGQSGWTTTRLAAGALPNHNAIGVDVDPSSPYSGSVYVISEDVREGYAAYLNYSRTGFGEWRRSAKINDSGMAIGATVAAGPDGTVYAMWEDFENGQVRMDRSTDGGGTWGADVVVHTYRMATWGPYILIPPQPHRGIVPWPRIAVAPRGGDHAGRIYVVYTDTTDPHWRMDSIVRFSDDGGTTWSAETRVNDDFVRAYQFHPAVAIAPNGVVGVSFSDTRRDPDTYKADRYVAFSTDGGLTWSVNERVTGAMSDESGSQASGFDYGDYQGLSAAGLAQPRFALSWTDSRPTAADEDLFAAGARP